MALEIAIRMNHLGACERENNSIISHEKRLQLEALHVTYFVTLAIFICIMPNESLISVISVRRSRFTMNIKLFT